MGILLWIEPLIVGWFLLLALPGRIARQVFAGALTIGDVAIYMGSAMQL